MNELTDTAEESERAVELLFGKRVARVGVKGIPIVEIDMGGRCPDMEEQRCQAGC